MLHTNSVLCLNINLLELVQNCHIRHNHSWNCCLGSQPNPKKGYGYYSHRHQVAGFENSCLIANAKFVNTGFDAILVAKYPLYKGTEVFVNYLT